MYCIYLEIVTTELEIPISFPGYLLYHQLSYCKMKIKLCKYRKLFSSNVWT